MANPNCPFCGRTLMLEEHKRFEETVTGRNRAYGIGKFYVCHKDKKHWPRNSVIMKVTARDGIKLKARRLL